jgi:antitoxin MazE
LIGRRAEHAPQYKRSDAILIGARAFEIAKVFSRRHLPRRLRKYRSPLPADFKLDRLEAHERE